jgi:hypothetical protein
MNCSKHVEDNLSEINYRQKVSILLVFLMYITMHGSENVNINKTLKPHICNLHNNNNNNNNNNNLFNCKRAVARWQWLLCMYINMK